MQWPLISRTNFSNVSQKWWAFYFETLLCWTLDIGTGTKIAIKRITVHNATKHQNVKKIRICRKIIWKLEKREFFSKRFFFSKQKIEKLIQQKNYLHYCAVCTWNYRIFLTIVINVVVLPQCAKQKESGWKSPRFAKNVVTNLSYVNYATTSKGKNVTKNQVNKTLEQTLTHSFNKLVHCF